MIEVSIVIPTYNEEKDIDNCIGSLLVQSYGNFELIIVDDGSTDKTRKIVKKLAKKDNRLKLVKGAHKGPGFSRNLGASKAKGKIFVFVDADMIFDKHFIKNLIKPILDGKVIGTEDGHQRASNPDNKWSRCWGTYIVKGVGKRGKRKGNLFRAILKSKFDEMGGFDPSLGYADDLTFLERFGIQSDVVDTALCYHKNPETLKEVYKQSRWIGASIRNKWIQNKVAPFFMIFLSPFLILYLAIKKCYSNKEFKIFFPWMLTFMTIRYFGSIRGIINKNYLKKNVR